MYREFSAGKDYTELRRKVLLAAAKLFITKGYTNSSTRQIAEAAGVQVSAMNRYFHSKDGILAHLVEYVLEGQFRTTHEKIDTITKDPILFYAAETTLQLYMAESSENIRNMYAAAYSLPETSAIIQKAITGKLEAIFKEYLPGLETKDFYKLEIASGGIMRGFLTIPCDMWFTMDQKVASFLECTFKIYDVPKAKIDEAVAFVSGIDYPAFAQEAISGMMQYLENYAADYETEQK